MWKTLRILWAKPIRFPTSKADKFDRSHPVVLNQYNSILVYKHNNFYHKNDNYQFLVRRHVSTMYSHHQANIESRVRYIKCALNGIPLSAHFIYLNLDSILA